MGRAYSGYVALILRAYQSAFSRYITTEAFQRDLTIFRPSKFPCRPPRRGILFALRRRRGQREDKLRISRVKRFFVGCHLCKHVLSWLGSCGFDRFNGMSRVLPRSPCARYSSLKQFLRIRKAKSFYFLPEHII